MKTFRPDQRSWSSALPKMRCGPYRNKVATIHLKSRENLSNQPEPPLTSYMKSDTIITWASKQPIWQQDALRRVALSLELSDTDIQEILANLRQANGLSREGEPVLQPLTRGHLQPDARAAPLAYLCSIDNVKNVNRLAQDQKLPFALDGITLIYGHNGSGKSGYCRILKKFCRAIAKDPIHPNVFVKGKPASAEARIRYKLESATDVSETTWRDGEDGPSDIAHLSVFDSHNARLYVDERNRIDYLPYEIELLTRFGQLLTKLQENLSAEIQVVERHLNVGLSTGYTPGTAVSELVNRLTSTTPLAELPTIEEINALGTWTEELAKDLDTLQKTIGNDPKALADRCRRVQGVVSSLIEELNKARDALSQDKATELEQAVRHACTTAGVAALAATTLLKDEPLKHVGSDPWRLMFQHAKEFSKLAYPDVEPPATREGDLCVLCQQPLAEEAAERLRRFENYVAGKARKDVEKAAAIRDKKSEAIEAVLVRSVEDAKSLLGEYAALSDARAETAAAVEIFAQETHERRAKLLAAVESGEFSDIVELDGSVIDKLRAERQALGDEAAAYDMTAGDDTRGENLKKELASLLDRKRLSENLETIHARRNDLELRARLQECVGAAKTNAVSHQVSALRKQLVTQDLNNRIRAEIAILALAHLPLLINDYSRKGESGFEVTLDAQQKVASRDVLSEGEQRALGLACFLADVNGQPVKHGIIVDDPVSSLDHVRIRRVAARLVREAATGRQVIIFTHNLLFFSEVMSLAAAHTPSPVPVLTNIVRKAPDLGFGVIERDDEPWEAKATNKRIILLREKIKALEAIVDKDGDAYRQGVEGFYTDLRETWERLVEEVLLSRVVERYGSDVKTQSLKGVVVDDEDYKTIFWAMKRASERSGHDMAAARNMPFQTVGDLKKEITALDGYRNQLRRRSKAVELRRKQLEQPPKAATA